MDVSIRKMYNYLLSHTFPGLLLTLQIILGLQWFAKFDAISLLKNLLSQEGGVVIVVLLVTYAVATLLGTIVDGIHHCLFDDVYVKIRYKYRALLKLPDYTQSVCITRKKFYDCFSNNMAYNAYQDRILDDYYYYSEAYANTAIIMIPGTFFLYHGLCNISNFKLCTFEVIFPLLVYILVVLIMAYQAITTHTEYEKEEKAFIASFSDRTQNGLRMVRETKSKQNLPHYGVYTRLRPSSIHGIGVFAIQEIKKGTYVFPGDDYPVVWVKKGDLTDSAKQIQQLYEDFAVVKDNGNLLGCPKNFNVLTVGWYMNHSDNPNVECDIEHDYDFFAIRDICMDEELTVDYTTLTDQPLKFK